MLAFLQGQLAWAQDKQTRFANRHRQLHPEYKIGDKVNMDAKNFVSERDSIFLSMQNAGSWEMVRNIDSKAYESVPPLHLFTSPSRLTNSRLTIRMDSLSLFLAIIHFQMERIHFLTTSCYIQDFHHQKSVSSGSAISDKLMALGVGWFCFSPRFSRSQSNRFTFAAHSSDLRSSNDTSDKTGSLHVENIIIRGPKSIASVPPKTGV